MLKITNPATEAVIKEIPTDDAASIKQKFDKARAAQTAWAALGIGKRLEIITSFKQMLEKDKEELAAILTSEVGKAISQSRNEVNGTIVRIDFFLQKAAETLKQEDILKDPANALEEQIRHEPLGVIANISAWNYPYFVGSNVFIPALLAGNAILYKPSEFATLTGLAITERLHRAGVPKDVFACVVGAGATGAEILKQPVNGVFFTGSYATGVKINEAVANRLIKVQLELGGKDPIYVCEDVNVAAAAEGIADGAFYNTGQSCCSVERIYVNEKVFDQFISHFMQTVQGFKTGDPMDDKTYIGPLTRSAQLKVLEAHVADAAKKGARLLAGGKRLKTDKGFYFEPTVFIDVNHTMDLMREESFGPIIGIQKVKDDEEALKMMNDSDYGLTAGVYTKDRARAEKILARVNSGSVYWNCCDRVSPRLPWSGRGHSGMGLTLSTHGILTFTQPKAWHLRG